MARSGYGVLRPSCREEQTQAEAVSVTPIAGMTLRTATARQCAVEQWLGSSGRGEVYQMRGDRQPAAPHLRERRQGAIENGALDNCLRCSLTPVISPNGRTCGSS